MTRAQAKDNLIAIGIAEPTDKQITDYLNQVGAETRSERSRADRYKEDAENASKLKDSLDETENKYKTALEEAQGKIAKLEKAQALVTTRNTVAKSMKLTAEQVEKYVKEDGTFDHEYLATLIAERETAAANAKEQEIASQQGNPGGGSPNDNNDTKSEAEKTATNIGKNIASANKASADVLANYI